MSRSRLKDYHKLSHLNIEYKLKRCQRKNDKNASLLKFTVSKAQTELWIQSKKNYWKKKNTHIFINDFKIQWLMLQMRCYSKQVPRRKLNRLCLTLHFILPPPPLKMLNIYHLLGGAAEDIPVGIEKLGKLLLCLEIASFEWKL